MAQFDSNVQMPFLLLYKHEELELTGYSFQLLQLINLFVLLSSNTKIIGDYKPVSSRDLTYALIGYIDLYQK